MSPLSLPAYILAGGKSSRFGSDKARALLDGLPLLLHVARTVQEVAIQITVVADQPHKYSDLGLRTIADHYPGRGPLAGLHTALTDSTRPDSPGSSLTTCHSPLTTHPSPLATCHSPLTTRHSPLASPLAGWCWLLSCDVPRFPVEWLRALLSQLQPGVVAVVYRGDIWHPLPGLYHQNLLPWLEQALARDQRAFWQLLQQLPLVSLPLPAGWRDLINVNTPRDLQQLQHPSPR